MPEYKSAEDLISLIDDQLEGWDAEKQKQLIVKLGNEDDVPDKVQVEVMKFYADAGWGAGVTMFLMAPKVLVCTDPSAEITHDVFIKFSNP